MADKWPIRFEVRLPTPELAATLAKHIEKGSTPLGAVRLEGIPVGRYKRWRRQGIDDIDAAYEAQNRALALTHEAYLVLAVEQATAKIAQQLGKQVQNGHEEWRAKLAWLERQERDDFQPAERVDITVGGSDEPVLIEGRAVVGLANVLDFVRQIGGEHLLGTGDSRQELPAARDLLSDPAAGERAAGVVPAADNP